MRRLASDGSLGLPGDLRLKNAQGPIASLYGRLVFFSSLYDRDVCRSKHQGLSEAFSDAEADRILEGGFRRTLDEWLRLNLEQENAHLFLYLSGMTGDARTVREAWVRARPCRNLLPLTAGEAERGLFLADLEALAAVMDGGPSLNSEVER